VTGLMGAAPSEGLMRDALPKMKLDVLGPLIAKIRGDGLRCGREGLATMLLAPRIHRIPVSLAFALAVAATASPARAADEPPAPAAAPAAPAAPPQTAAPPPKWNRALPIGADWALERGVDLPRPFGAGVFLVTMSRDIEVTDVRVSLRDGEPVSVGDVGTFAVRNHTTLAAAKLDAWVFPLLDVYVLGGHAWTDSRLSAAFEVDPIGPRPPTVVEVTQDANVGGPLLGGGATLVAGYGPWFVLADGNYTYSWIDGLEGGLGAWFLSARTGWSGRTGWGSWRGWLGAAYLRTGRTLTITRETSLGTMTVDVDQQAVNPLTAQAGGSVGLGKRWEVLAEVGSNFGDAFVGVFSASFRH
jgi:hypothetical protein